MLPSTAVLVPMLGRPHTVAPLARSLADNTPEPHRLLFVCSPKDRAVHEAVRAEGLEPLVLSDPPGRGDYARKIHAGIAATDDPLLFLGACDLQFHYRWLSRAIAKLARGVGVVGTNDLGSPRVIRGEHATHCLVTRDYVSRGLVDGTPGLLFEGYQHEWVDDELIGTARSRNALAFAPDSHVEHLHPSWGKAPMDPMYAKQRQRMRGDRPLFLNRRRMWT
jgi:hypothetical protein